MFQHSILVVLCCRLVWHCKCFSFLFCVRSSQGCWFLSDAVGQYEQILYQSDVVKWLIGHCNCFSCLRSNIVTNMHILHTRCLYKRMRDTFSYKKTIKHYSFMFCHSSHPLRFIPLLFIIFTREHMIKILYIFVRKISAICPSRNINLICLLSFFIIP